jgi:hypothetical protein
MRESVCGGWVPLCEFPLAPSIESILIPRTKGRNHILETKKMLPTTSWLDMCTSASSARSIGIRGNRGMLLAYWPPNRSGRSARRIWSVVAYCTLNRTVVRLAVAG